MSKSKTVVWRCPPANVRSEIILPDSVCLIAPGAFANCKNIQRVVCSGKLQMIGRAAFMLSGIETLISSKGINAIDDFAFAGCGSLREISVPVPPGSVATNAFSSCPNLHSSCAAWARK